MHPDQEGEETEGQGGEAVARAAAMIRQAGALVVTAGAGMGVDSGLPDFRGDEGFWCAYPPYRRLGIAFEDAANPAHFARDPAFGWGFYGHRLALYRRTVPHAGFALLRRWSERFGLPLFVVTSNVDGQFQRAGFAEEALEEIHGSIHHLQCAEGCTSSIWRNEEEVEVDEAPMRSRTLPRCPRCGGMARPNILMFGDWGWIPDRSREQHRRFEQYLAPWRGAANSTSLAVIELGAGTAIPSIRRLSEQLGRLPSATVVRINPREPGIAAPHLSLATGALAGLAAIDRALA